MEETPGVQPATSTTSDGTEALPRTMGGDAGSEPSPASTLPPGWELVGDPTGRTGGGTVVIAYGLKDAAHFVPGTEPEPALKGRIIIDETSRFSFQLMSENERFTIGRDRATCDAVVDDPRVSRVHLAIGVRDHVPFIEDLGSSNGTCVDGIRITEKSVLRHGAQVRFGRTEVVFDFD